MPDEGWTPVSVAAQRDYRLTWRARGLLGELLSYPDGWDTNIDKLVAQARRQGDATEGREAMRRAMAELATVGYVRYVRERDQDGKWGTVIYVSDDPMPDPTSRRTKVRSVGDADVPETQSSGTPHVGEPGGRVSDTSEGWVVTTNTDTKTVTHTDGETSSYEHSASLASLATAADAAARKLADEQEKQLEKVYAFITELDKDACRRQLLVIERKRPKIYREARQHAIRQIERNDPDSLKSSASAVVIDQLSYKYIARHYSPNFPQWFTRPLDEAYRAATGRRAA